MVVSSIVVSVVGRTGGAAVAEEEELVVEGGQLIEPHDRSVGQQPPPKEAGQDWYPDEQVRTSGVDVTVTVLVTVDTSGDRVDGLCAAVVEVVVVVEVEGEGVLDTDGVIVVYDVTVVVEADGKVSTVAVDVWTHPTS